VCKLFNERRQIIVVNIFISVGCNRVNDKIFSSIQNNMVQKYCRRERAIALA